MRSFLDSLPSAHASEVSDHADALSASSIEEEPEDTALIHGLLLHCKFLCRDYEDFANPMTLHNYLVNRRRCGLPLSNEHIAGISEQILDALAYMHLPFKPQGSVINGGLSTSTVLITHDLHIRLLLPGLTRDKIERWLYSDAPELVTPNKYTMHKNIYLSTKTDIWAYGKILLNLATLGAGLSSVTKQPHFAAQYPRWIYDAINSCTNIDPSLRPSATFLLNIPELKNARAHRISGASSPSLAHAESHKLVSEAINSMASSVEKASRQQMALIKFTHAFFKVGADTLLATIAAEDKPPDPALLLCLKDADILQEVLSIARSKRLSRTLAIVAEYVFNHGLFVTVPLLSPIAVPETTLAMQHIQANRVQELLQLLADTSFISPPRYAFEGLTALMMASMRGYTDCVWALLNEFAVESQRPSALLQAMMNNHYSCIKPLVLEVGLNGVTPLMYYASIGDAAQVHHYLESPLSYHYLRCQTTTGWTALMFAASGGFVLCTELLMRHENGMQDALGETALMKASIKKNIKVIDLFVQAKSNELGLQTVEGRTALMLAAQNNAVDAVLALYQFEKSVRDYSGITALMLAAQENSIASLRVLLDHEAGLQSKVGLTALMFAATRGHIECVSILSAKEAGLQDELGLTALMYAAQSGYSDCTALLVEREMRLRDKTGWTALMYAAQGGHVKCVENILAQTSLQTSPLPGPVESKRIDYSSATLDVLAALSYDSPLLFSTLESSPAEARLQSNDGSTALMIAAQCNHVSCVKILTDAEYKMKDSRGWTALMRAAHIGSTECVAVLLPFEAGIQHEDGMTALMYAAQGGQLACVKALLPWELGQTRKDGKTALMLAARAGQSNCVKELSSGQILAKNQFYSPKCEQFEEYISYSPSMPSIMNDSLRPTVPVTEVRMRDELGWTALLYAVVSRDRPSMSLLLEYEGDMRSPQGMTALDLAYQQEDPAIIDIIQTYEENITV